MPPGARPDVRPPAPAARPPETRRDWNGRAERARRPDRPVAESRYRTGKRRSAPRRTVGGRRGLGKIARNSAPCSDGAAPRPGTVAAANGRRRAALHARKQVERFRRRGLAAEAQRHSGRAFARPDAQPRNRTDPLRLVSGVLTPGPGISTRCRRPPRKRLRGGHPSRKQRPGLASDRERPSPARSLLAVITLDDQPAAVMADDGIVPHAERTGLPCKAEPAKPRASDVASVDGREQQACDHGDQHRNEHCAKRYTLERKTAGIIIASAAHRCPDRGTDSDAPTRSSAVA